MANTTRVLGCALRPAAKGEPIHRGEVGHPTARGHIDVWLGELIGIEPTTPHCEAEKAVIVSRAYPRSGPHSSAKLFKGLDESAVILRSSRSNWALQLSAAPAEIGVAWEMR